MGEPAIIQASGNDAAQDTTANRAIRDVASTPSPQHIIPAGIVAFLYEHVDFMRAELFNGQVPPVVLSFEVTDRRTLGHYHLMRTGLGVRWALNLNPVHLARPVFEVLATLLHELAHAWQHERGTPPRTAPSVTWPRRRARSTSSPRESSRSSTSTSTSCAPSSSAARFRKSFSRSK